MSENKPKITRRSALASLAAGTACLCGCTITPPKLVTELPYNSPEDVPHGSLPSNIDTKNIVLPSSPRLAETTPIGPVIPRASWTSVGPDLKNVRPMDGVKLVTFHHSGDGKPFLASDTTSVAKHIEAVRQWHRQRGMVDIGYHFAIDRAGRVWQLRHLKYEGQHVRIGKNGTRWNEHNVGIVVLGDFNLQDPTRESKDRILEFAKFLTKFYALPASAVHTHGELVETDCPGGTLGPYIKSIRKSL